MTKITPNRNPGFQQPLANPQVMITASQGFSPIWSRPQANTEDLDAIMSSLKSLETGLYQAARLSQNNQALKDKQLATRRTQLEGAAGADGDAEGAMWASRFDTNTLDDPLSQAEIDSGETPNANRTDLYAIINAYTESGLRPEDAIRKWIELKIPRNYTQFDPDMTDQERQTQLLELNAYRKKYEPAALAAGLKWYQDHYIREIVETRGHYEAEFLALAPTRSEMLPGPVANPDGTPMIGSSGLETVGIRRGRGIAGYAKHLREQDPHMAQMSNQQVADLVLRAANIAAMEHGDFKRANLLLDAVKESGLAGEERVKLRLQVERKEIDVNMKSTFEGVGRLARSVAVVDPNDEAIRAWATAVDVSRGSSEHARRIVDSIKAMDSERASSNVSLHERLLAIQNLMDATVPRDGGGRQRVLVPGDEIYDKLSLYRGEMERTEDAAIARKKEARDDTRRVMTNLTVRLMLGLDRATEDNPFVMTLPSSTSDGTPIEVEVRTLDELHDYILKTYPEDGPDYIDASLRKATSDAYGNLSPVARAQREKFTEISDLLRYSPRHQTRQARRQLLMAAMDEYDNNRLTDAQYQRINSLASEQLAYGGAMSDDTFQDYANSVEAAFMAAAGASPMTGGPVPTWMLAKDGDPRAKAAAERASKAFSKDYRSWLSFHVDEQFSDDQAVREQWELKRERHLDKLLDYHASLAAYDGVDYSPTSATARNRRGETPPTPQDFNLWTLPEGNTQ